LIYELLPGEPGLGNPITKRTRGVMVSVLASSWADFQGPVGSHQSKKCVFVASPLST